VECRPPTLDRPLRAQDSFYYTRPHRSSERRTHARSTDLQCTDTHRFRRIDASANAEPSGLQSLASPAIFCATCSVVVIQSRSTRYINA